MVFLEEIVRRYIFSILVFISLIPCIHSTTSVTENSYVSGVISVGKTEQFVVTTKLDWQYYQFTFTIVSQVNSGSSSRIIDLEDENTEIAQVQLMCTTSKKEHFLYNNITQSIFSRESACAKESTAFTIKNYIEKSIHYSVIVQRMDDISLSYQMDSEIESTISGYSTDSMRSYRIFLSNSDFSYSSSIQEEEDKMIDMFEISLKASSPSLKAYLSSSAYPMNRNRHEFLFNTTTQESIIQVDFTSPLYSINHDIYLILLVEESSNSLITYTISSSCSLSSQVLPNTIKTLSFEEGVNCTSHIQQDPIYGYAILDLTSILLYDNLNITFSIDDYQGEGSVLFSHHSLRIPTTDSTLIKGNFPLQYQLQKESSLFQLHSLLYIKLIIPAQSSISSCYFTIQTNFTQTYTLPVLDYENSYSTTTINQTTIQYYAVWIPAEGFGKVEHVIVSLDNIHYYWSHNGTVCTPLSIYISFNTKPIPSNLLDSANIKKEATLTYQTSYSMTIIPDDVSIYMIIAIETKGTASWSIYTPIKINPYSPTPGSPVRGYVSTYETSIHGYIYLYVLKYTPIVLSVSKLSTDYRSLIFLVAIDQYPTLDDYDWRSEHIATTESYSVNITISRSHPKYCSKCKYYMTVYLFNSTIISQDSTYLSLDFLCSKEYCSWCSEGWDPLENCKECLQGYYGTSCLSCPNCNHGSCFDGIAGNGTCTCNTGFTEASNCTDCSNGFYGEDCIECPTCNNHGICNDGKTGNGTCECENGFDSSLYCSNCLQGYYGNDCSQICLGNLNCNGNGACDDGIDGTGRCTCREGYVGLSCDTLYENDKCNPHCFTGNGACDEENGVCVCWDDHSGIDCNYNLSELINLYILLSLIIIISIVSFVFILRVKVLSQKKTKKQKERKKMIVDPENRSISWRTIPTSSTKKVKRYETLHEEDEYE